MKKIINAKTLEYLANLARIGLNKEKEEKMVKDLEEILEYFEEIKNVDVLDIKPITGGIESKNVFRQDDLDVNLSGQKCQTSNVELKDAFPEKEDGFLKVLGVFEE